MKVLIFGLFFFTSFFCSSAQDVPKDTLTFKDLDYAQMMQWDSVETAWSRKYLLPFFKQHKIKISCGGCSRFIMDIYFPVNADGSSAPQLLSIKRCATGLTKKQTKQLSKLLSHIKFTAAFYNRNYRLTIGRVLKC
ncbi:MAG: hypothetical protein K0S33_1857 [Bacteroidetes bacterium]|jgi:hypothetical protein|nr:hypothetical protein [Bacteroidota bacterium]